MTEKQVEGMKPMEQDPCTRLPRKTTTKFLLDDARRRQHFWNLASSGPRKNMKAMLHYIVVFTSDRGRAFEEKNLARGQIQTDGFLPHAASHMGPRRAIRRHLHELSHATHRFPDAPLGSLLQGSF